MAGRQWYIILFTLFLCSCADPKYASANDHTRGNQGQKAGDCQAKFASGHCVFYEWEKMPTDEAPGSFVFKIFHLNPNDGTPVLEDLSGNIAVVLWMPSMGHGSSPVTVERLDAGTYRASRVFFIMRGDWDIRFQLKDGASVKDQAIISITL